ncbi:MAG: hypothetical protein CO108_03685 [Deltaproteobacteria bacterium CG_4_9_14_3_um_filter_63_12]|nr:MAG: hypothetical protein COW42_10805 [Deltaproteobacteria bacterium CG17_big_fil_post_rev_8_21_14_2_50_63_7]PJB47665.1 MAG: hypothetical protein CO108_03685 [Deltaproteobacteria bacterium CG_4_9_14_3_um_filter_63_12]
MGVGRASQSTTRLHFMTAERLSFNGYYRVIEADWANLKPEALRQDPAFSHVQDGERILKLVQECVEAPKAAEGILRKYGNLD